MRRPASCKSCGFVDYNGFCTRSECWFNEQAEEDSICKNKECRHLVHPEKFCPNPDCFYHKNLQTEVEQVRYHDE